MRENDNPLLLLVLVLPYFPRLIYFICQEKLDCFKSFWNFASGVFAATIFWYLFKAIIWIIRYILTH
jgi:hypothetical protein